MVNYEEFKENFKEDVTRELAKTGIEDVEIIIQPNEKLNQRYDALTVRPDGSTLGLSLNFTKIAEGIFMEKSMRMPAFFNKNKLLSHKMVYMIYY